MVSTIGRLFCCILLLVIGGCKREAGVPATRPAKQETTAEVPRDPVSGESPLIAAYTRFGFRPDRPFSPVLVFAMYPGGRIWYSGNALEGGPPYFEKQISKSELRETWQRARSIVADGPSDKLHRIPDMSEVEILVKDESEHGYTCLVSFHDFVAPTDQSIATQNGLIPLNGGRSEEAVKATWTADYRRFRDVWSSLRELMRSVADKGRQMESDPEIDWHQERW
ncbi:MAG: hypothetical protein ACM359_14330 [Bacillota bacterium]